LGLAFADAPLIADFDLKDDREAHEEHQKGALSARCSIAKQDMAGRVSPDPS